MASDFCDLSAEQRRSAEHLLNAAIKMIWSLERSKPWRVKDARRADNRAWKREQRVMVREPFWVRACGCRRDDLCRNMDSAAVRGRLRRLDQRLCRGLMPRVRWPAVLCVRVRGEDGPAQRVDVGTGAKGRNSGPCASLWAGRVGGTGA